MSEDHAHYQIAADIMVDWKEGIQTGTPPIFYCVGSGELSRVEIGPGLIMMLGAAPGAGKTALAMQFVTDALRMTPDLRAVVCNVEMAPAVLLDRQLSRLSGIDLTTIRYRKITSKHAERIDLAMNTLEPLMERLAFVRPPFDLANVAATVDAFGAELVVLDYIQRIQPPGDYKDNHRSSVNATMDCIRKFADRGGAVIVVAAVSRTKDSKGRVSYDGSGLNLASFRESSELEFGADDAYMLVPNPKDETEVTLRHLKARHGETRDITLTFDRHHQHFAASGADDTDSDQTPEDTVLASRLRALWGGVQ